MSSSGLAKLAVKKKELVKSNQLSVAEGSTLLTSSWKNLVLAQSLSLKDISACRSLIEACIKKWPNLLDELGMLIISDLTQSDLKNDVRGFSRSFQAALDSESGKKSLTLFISASSPNFFFTALDKCLKKLEVIFQNQNEITQDFLEVKRDADRCFDCIFRTLTLSQAANAKIEHSLL